MRELATAQAIARGTAAALGPTVRDARAIRGRRGRRSPAVLWRLAVVGNATAGGGQRAVPAADSASMQANGTKVQGAATRLKSVSAIPAADLTSIHPRATRRQHIGEQLPEPGRRAQQTVDASSTRRLGNNPNDIAAQNRALSQLTGVGRRRRRRDRTRTSRQAAGEQLKSISTVPANDLKYLGVHGPRLERISKKYPAQIKTLQRSTPTLKALDKDPKDVDDRPARSPS